MRTALCCLALAVLPVYGQVARVAIYTKFEQEPPPAVFDSAKQEAAAIMAPAGLRFEWRSLTSIRGNEAFVELAVVTFQGHCGADQLAAQPFKAGALGFTYSSQGAVIPFARVDCSRIRAFLGSALLHTSPLLRERALGRAIGRVLAHELFHVLTRSAQHQPHGVNQDSYGVSDLMADQFHLDPDQFRILQTRPATEDAGLTIDRAGSADAGESVYMRSGCGACHGSGGQGTSHGPALRLAGQPYNSVRLAAMLGEDSHKMCERARDLKIPPPSLAEDDIPDLVYFLNAAGL